MNCIACKNEIPEGSLFCNHCGKKQSAVKKRRARKRSNNTGTVWKLQGRRARPWIARKDGVVIGYYATVKEAEAALAEFVQTPVSDRYNFTLDEVYKLWKAEHEKTTTAKSMRGYEGAYKYLEFLKDKKLREIRTEDWQSAIDKMEDLSYSSKHKVRLLAGMLSEYGIREEIIKTNFARYVVLPEKVEKEVETFNAEEVEKLVKSNGQIERVILLMIYTGMRIGELFTIKTENCHEAYMIGGNKTEKGKNRIIPVPENARAIYSDLRKSAAGKELLVQGYSIEHNADNFRKRCYYPTLERLGIRRLVPHTTRKSFISANVEAGTAPEVLKVIVGHADYNTSNKYYTKIKPETLVEAVSGLSIISNKLATNAKTE